MNNKNKYDEDSAPIIRGLSRKNGGSLLGGSMATSSMTTGSMASSMTSNSMANNSTLSGSILSSSIPNSSMLHSSMAGHSGGSLANSPAKSSSTTNLIGHRSPGNSSRNSSSNEMCGLDVPDGALLFGGRSEAPFGRGSGHLGQIGQIGSYSDLSGMKAYENHYLNKRKLSSKNEDQCSLLENMSCLANGLDGRLDEEVFDYESNTEHYQKKKVVSASAYKYSSSSDKSDIDLISFTDTDSISLANDKDEENEKNDLDGKCLCALTGFNWLIC